VWRDILCEGPIAADIEAMIDVRAAWIAAEMGADAADYRRDWARCRQTLDAGRYDEIALWFEQDLFCAVNLWYVLPPLSQAGARVSLVYPSLGMGALGTTPPARYGPLLEARVEVTPAAGDEAALAWAAYAAPEPIGVSALAAAPERELPFVTAAMRLHAGRFPDRATGLSEPEAITLTAVARGEREFTPLFRTVRANPTLAGHGMGDLQLAATLRRLAASSMPLVTIDALDRRPAEWRVSATPAADRALSGERPWPGADEHDRWIGGVRLGRGRPRWRRDGHVLVQA
jgi:hypothetical protein